MKKINIAVVGLGQIGNYLLHELNSKKKDSSFFNNLILYLGSNQYIGHYSRAIDITKQNYLFGSGFKSYRKVCGRS